MTPFNPDRIMAQARAAQPSWAALSVSHRCAFLGRMTRELALNCESIAETIAHETAKPALDALSGDILVTLESMRYYERHASRILRRRKPTSTPSLFFRGKRFETHFEPHGVVLVFGPSNYPLQLSMIPVITALVAGNAVILKCSERTPKTAALISRLCAKAELPGDLVQVLNTSPEQSGALIDAHPDMIFFTGSTRHGQAVAERAAKHLIPTILELGGKDPSLVFADCHLDRAIEGITYGAYSNAGRVCVATKRVYVEISIYEEFLRHLTQRIKALRVRMELDADLYPLSALEAAALRAQIEDALARGAVMQTPRGHIAIGTDPVLLTDVPPDARILTDECFGPVLCIAPFQTEAHAVALANNSPFALSASIWTHNWARARRVSAQLSAGSCAVNDVIRVIANPYVPFGGNRRSGHGRYHGPEGLRAFSRTKTIMLSGDRRSREINWFPFTERTRRHLARLLRFRHGQTGLVAHLNRIVMPILLALILCAPMASQPKMETHLTINFRLDPNAHGELAYLVFDSPAGFPDAPQKALRHGFLSIPSGAHQMHIEIALPPGTYAVSAYVDLNDNHRLDRTFLGIPREPVGVSNNPPARLGPPRFDESSFHLGSNAKIIDVAVVQAR